MKMGVSYTDARKFKKKCGPSNLVKKVACRTTMAISTLTKLEAKRYLRRGDGIMTMPACRRRERLFGSRLHGSYVEAIARRQIGEAVRSR